MLNRLYEKFDSISDELEVFKVPYANLIRKFHQEFAHRSNPATSLQLWGQLGCPHRSNSRVANRVLWHEDIFDCFSQVETIGDAYLATTNLLKEQVNHQNHGDRQTDRRADAVTEIFRTDFAFDRFATIVQCSHCTLMSYWGKYQPCDILRHNLEKLAPTVLRNYVANSCTLHSCKFD